MKENNIRYLCTPYLAFIFNLSTNYYLLVYTSLRKQLVRLYVNVGYTKIVPV